MNEFILHIANGQIVNKSVIRDRFTNLQDGKYLVTVKSIKKRTLLQNSYYWGCMFAEYDENLKSIVIE